MSHTERPLVLSAQQIGALHKLDKYRRLRLGADGYYRVDGRCWWSMDPKLVRQLVARDLARIERVGTATFVVAVPR